MIQGLLAFVNNDLRFLHFMLETLIYKAIQQSELCEQKARSR